MAVSGCATFKIAVTGNKLLTLPSFEFTLDDYPNVEKIEVSTPDERSILIKFSFTSIPSQHDGTAIAEAISAQIADWLAFEYTIAASDPSHSESSWSDDDDPSQSLQSTLGFAMRAHVVHAVHERDLPSLVRNCRACSSVSDSHRARLRWILQREDSVARFMHLYSLLLELKGGPNHTQREVDLYIQSIDPQVAMVQPPGRQAQTIYTRLRNEVGHVIQGVTPESTAQQMEQHMANLIIIVKSAI